MIYITGDTHGEFSRFIPFINLFIQQVKMS